MTQTNGTTAIESLVRGKGFEPLNLYGPNLKSGAFGRLGYPHRYTPKPFCLINPDIGRPRNYIAVRQSAYVSQNIANAESVANAVRTVMNTKGRIESQRELHSLVLKELRRNSPKTRVSATRVRRIAVSSGAVKIEIEYRETDRSDLPNVCPVCGNGMSPIYNGTLEGKIVEIKRNCSVCPYSVGKKVLMPGRYAFVRVADRETSIEEMRLRKLKKAASLLRGASKLIGEALEGTNFPQRKEYAQEAIGNILESREMTGSIPNLMADIRRESHSDPLWTKPLSSPKYPDGKDI